MDHDHQDGNGQGIDVRGSHLIRGILAYFYRPVVAGSSKMLNRRTKLFSVTQVNQGKLEIITEHQVVRLNISVSQVIRGVEIEYCRTQLLDKVTL